MLQSVEIEPDDALDAAVRAEWSVLADAGLPSQVHHAGPTNAPHVTLVVAEEVGDEDAVVEAARGLVGLPLTVGPVVVLGGRRRVLARLVVPTVDLLTAQARVHAALATAPGVPPTSRPDAWVPHVTLARGLDTVQVSAALDLLEGTARRPDLVGSVAAVRRWDPVRREAWTIAP